MKNCEYELRYMHELYSDFQSIVEYIRDTLKNKEAANKLSCEVSAMIVSRASYPDSFEPIYSSSGEAYYRIYVGNYTILYVLKDDSRDGERIMEVRRIVYSRMDFKNLI